MNTHNTNNTNNRRDEEEEDMKSFKVGSTVKRGNAIEDTQRKVKSGAYNYG